MDFRDGYLMGWLNGRRSAVKPKAPANWFRDPTGRHEDRWWDGSSWTDRVRDGDAESTDPYRPAGRRRRLRR